MFVRILSMVFYISGGARFQPSPVASMQLVDFPMNLGLLKGVGMVDGIMIASCLIKFTKCHGNLRVPHATATKK